MDGEPLKNIYQAEEIDLSHSDINITLGNITEKDKFLAAKQILLGLALLYIITLSAYLFRPSECQKLLDVITTTFPPLATLILVSYFHKNP
jgi:hypothetical protein